MIDEFSIDSTPSWNTTLLGDDPNQPLKADVTTMFFDRQLLQSELDSIQAALQQMEADAKSPDKGKVFMAMMVAITQVFPAIEEYKGDNIRQLADNENVASDLRAFVTSAQAGFNDTTKDTTDAHGAGNGADMTRGVRIYQSLAGLFGLSPDGNNPPDFDEMNVHFTINGVHKSESWLNLLTDTDVWGSATPISLANKGYLTQAIGNIEGEFGNNWVDKMDNVTAMGHTVWQWQQASLTPQPSGPPIPSAELKSVQSDLQQGTQATSTQATSLQTQEQYYTQEFNQITGVDNSIKQSQASQVTTLVHNQRAGA